MKDQEVSDVNTNGEADSALKALLQLHCAVSFTPVNAYNMHWLLSRSLSPASSAPTFLYLATALSSWPAPAPLLADLLLFGIGLSLKLVRTGMNKTCNPEP